VVRRYVARPSENVGRCHPRVHGSEGFTRHVVDTFPKRCRRLNA
jgi:hypothetical protein